MNYKNLQKTDKSIYELTLREIKRQQETLMMIPSENYASFAVLETLGSPLTNKYSEGYPGKRYYGGNQYIDEIEQLAINRAKELFGAEHANVQPLSGAPANLAVYSAFLEPGDTVLGMDLEHGGHLTHGHPVTYSAKIYNFVRYKTDSQSGEIDYIEIEKMAKENNPKLILTGYSAYSKDIDYQKVKAIADKVGAYSMADIAHTAGLVASGFMNNPVPIFDVVTMTTHKTLRGPRGGLILCKKEYAKQIDKAVFPGLQGGPHENNIAAKAVAFAEALKSEFKDYSKQILNNAKTLEQIFKENNFTICFGETKNHLLLIDLTNKNITGKQAQQALDKAGITINMNMIPNDKRSPQDPSGIRLGTPALTTRGMKLSEMRQIGQWIAQILANPADKKLQDKVKKEVKELTKQFPIYPSLSP